ncbi:MAG: T9SS type A sorting domain-containing protein [Bacteroidia bacterium]
MKKFYSFLFFLTLSTFAFSQTSECDSLTSPCQNTFSGKSYYFDVQAITDVNIERFSMVAQNCGQRDISIYYRQGTYMGHETNASDWTLGGSISAFEPACAGSCPIPETIIPVLLDVCIPAGQTFAFYIATTGGTGTIEGHTDSLSGHVIAEDSHLKIFAGSASLNTGAFDAFFSVDRSWQGSVQYDCSCIVSAEENSLTTNFSTSIQQNPAVDNLNYIINSNEVSLIEINITDITGKVVQQHKKEVAKGKNNFSFDVSSLSGGVYFISVSDISGIKSVDKFVKH